MLEDIDGVDPYAECRMAICVVEKASASVALDRKEGISSEQMRQRMMARVREIREHFGRFVDGMDCDVILQQAESPAFLSYLAGLMGEM